MERFGHDVQRSVATSRKREQAIILLSSMAEAYPRALAHALNVDVTRLHEIMRGAPPRYSMALSPIALGLAREIETPHGRIYEITGRGRAKARQLTSRRMRDAAARAARAEWNATRRGPQVHPHARRLDPPPVPAPVVTSTFSFSWPLRNP